VSVVAIVAQQSAAVRRYVEDNGLPFYILVDETREVTKAYGVWHRVGLDAWNIARPALFVIKATGTIQAIFVGESQEEFPSPAEIEAALGGLA
jgi:methyl-accepting chemotaxis protein